MYKKIQPLILVILVFKLTLSAGWAQAPAISESPLSGPISLEPAVEKNGVRVALRTSIKKKNELSVLIKISNLSDQPVLVSPDAVEASTEEGFIMQPAGSSNSKSTKWSDSNSENTAWSRFSKVAALIPFSDPYRIVSSTRALAEYAEKKGIFEKYDFKNTDLKNTDKRGLLHEVILQPGMATHGLVIYDASLLKAFEYAPGLRIKVTVSGEPFEFKFASQPRTVVRSQ